MDFTVAANTAWRRRRMKECSKKWPTKWEKRLHAALSSRHEWPCPKEQTPFIEQSLNDQQKKKEKYFKAPFHTTQLKRDRT